MLIDSSEQFNVLDSVVAPKEIPDDNNLDNTLRPQNFTEYIGQNNVKKKPPKKEKSLSNIFFSMVPPDLARQP